MKESNEILSSVYRATPTLFQRFMPQIPQLAGQLPLQMPLLQTQSPAQLSPTQLAQHHLLQQQPPKTETPPTPSNELSIDQNCTPPSSTSSSNSTVTSVSPLDFNSFVAAAASTPVMSPLMMPTPKYPYEIRNFLNNPETICETAARLLFMCVRWAKSIPAFVNLDMSDQVSSSKIHFNSKSQLMYFSPI